MKTSRYIALATAAALTSMLAGCQTTNDAKSVESNVRVNKGAFAGNGSPIPNDIKSILMAGGLDVANPSAPTSATAKSEIAKSQAHASTETLVAALSDKPTINSVAAAQTPKVAAVREPPATRTDKNDPKSSTALALAEVATPREKQIKTVFETRLEVDHQPVTELASINGTGSPVVSDDAFSVAYPLPDSMKPTVAATETKAAGSKPVAKASRPPQVATNDDVSQKKSRVRRF